MADFAVRVNELNGGSMKLSEIEKKVGSYAASIGRIKTTLVIHGSGSDGVRRAIGDIQRDLEERKQLIKGAGKTLSVIAQEYQNSENRISGVKTISKGSVKKSGAPMAMSKSNPSFTDSFDYKPIDVLKSFGNLGKVIGIVDKGRKATTWNQWASVALSIWNTGSKIVKDIKGYAKIGRAIGTKNASSYFVRNLVGLNAKGYASTCKSPFARFRNNLTNSKSPYNIRDAFGSLTGKNGAGKAVAAWAGVALTGVTNLFSNLDEQKASKGKMSTERVIAETITETAVDTVITYAGTAVVGAAITAVTGAVAAPVVVAVATGVAIAGINAGVKALTGKTATEMISDGIIDGASWVGKQASNASKAVGDAATKATKAVGKWFKSVFA